MLLPLCSFFLPPWPPPRFLPHSPSPSFTSSLSRAVLPIRCFSLSPLCKAAEMLLRADLCPTLPTNSYVKVLKPDIAELDSVEIGLLQVSLVKLRCGQTGRGLAPTQNERCPYERGNLDTDRHLGRTPDNTRWRWSQRLGWCFYEPRNKEGGQQFTGNQGPDGTVSSSPPRDEIKPTYTRETAHFCRLSHPVCGILFRQPRELILFPSTSSFFFFFL